jgi:hypothetical protein
MKLYEASVREPYAAKACTLEASSEAQLKVRINLRINALTCEMRRSAKLSLLVLGATILFTLVTVRLSPISIYLLLPVLLTTAFITRRSTKFNPFARLCCNWRCLKMWQIELARRSAPEAQNWYR